MQLKKPPGALRFGLMAASCSLLGTTAVAQTTTDTPVDEEQPWQFDTGLLYYKENQRRTTAAEPAVTLRKDFGDEHVFGFKFEYATLSGGSTNGALPSKKLQTFATASGVRLQNPDGSPITYTTPSGQTVAQLRALTLFQVAPGQLPTDPKFHEQRIALAGSWSQPFAGANHINLGAELSHELDYLSVGGSLGLSRDFNSRRTTFGFAINAESDSVKPPGGAPVPVSDYRLTAKEGSKAKSVKGGMVSLSQLITSNWNAQLNYVLDKEHGYLTDPYKILSVLDSTGSVTDYRFENRPNSRTRKSLFLDNRIAIGRTVLDVSFRHGSDDWNVRANTIESSLRFNVYGEDIYLEPHLRWYHQSAASFYQLYVNAANALPTYASPDTRLAEFTAKTIGVKLGFLLQDRAELTFRLEVYHQDPAVRSSPLAGLTGFDLNPSLRAIVFQVGWRHGF